ncbi:MAG TPA: AbrB/MazE/SpoVT family DNA-binding domain-containing protein [Streptosporangiaceae bacterium]|nr:AbrB/MazE/SpoVT family DNA-binding domain-containing protein [Streptosporangiaceae bacterium]
MTASVIPPVIPSSAPARGRAAAGVAASRALPLAGLPPRAAPAGDVVYGLGRVDASGRIADRAVLGALGWRDGDRLTMTADAGVVVARRDPGGMVTLPSRPCVVIPAALRRRCGLQPGDRVLLAALPGQDVLAALPLAILDEAIREHGPFPPGEGATR